MQPKPGDLIVYDGPGSASFLRGSIGYIDKRGVVGEGRYGVTWLFTCGSDQARTWGHNQCGELPETFRIIGHVPELAQ